VIEFSSQQLTENLTPDKSITMAAQYAVQNKEMDRLIPIVNKLQDAVSCPVKL
jgi:hypothetical protein